MISFRHYIGVVTALMVSLLFISSCDLLIAQDDSTHPVEKAPGEELPDLEERLSQVEGMEKDAGDKNLSLHELVKQEKYASILGRLRTGSDPNTQDDQGQTLLHVAVAESEVTMALILIENGADINLKDKQNQTPIDLAKQHPSEEFSQNFISLMQKRDALVKEGKHKVARVQKTHPISVWIEPLKTHHANLKKIDERFRILGSLQNPPPKKDVKKQGEMLIASTLLACAFLDKYSNTTRGPRRGLQEELELVREMRSMVERSTIFLQKLSQLQLPQDEDSNYEEKTKSIAHQAALTYLKHSISERLEREGLGEFIKEEHLELFRQKSSKQIEKSLHGYLDKQLVQRIGIRLNDLNSLQAAARAKVRFHVRQEVAKLVLEISSNQFVIRLAQQVVLVLLEEKLWPLIREGLRPKGNLEERTYASVETLMQSCAEMAALSNSDPSKLDVREASKVLRSAEGRINAMRYLLKDAKKAKREDLLSELELAKSLLATRHNIVSYQFMLTEDNEVQEQVADEITIMKGLLEIARYLVGHISETNLVLQGSGRVETALSFAISPTVVEFDQKGYQREKANRPEIAVKRRRFYKVWGKEYVVQSQFNGRKIYSYRFWRPSRGGDISPRIGNYAWLCGVNPGTHVVQASVVTLDGEVYDFEYELEVKPISQRSLDGIDYAYKKIKSERGKFQRVNSTKKKAQAARYYSSALIAFMYSFMRSGGEKSCEVQQYLDECNAVAAWLLKGEPDEGRTLEAHFIKIMAAMCKICEQQGTAASFEKAKQYAAQAEKVQARTGLRGIRAMADCYNALKNMSVAVFNDVAMGRQYHEKFIKAQLNAGINLVGIDWVRNEFPKQIKVPAKTKAANAKD